MIRPPAELIALALILGMAGGSALAVALLAPAPREAQMLPTLAPPSPTRSPTSVPAIVPGPIDGLPTPRRRALRRPIAAVIDNFYPDARPQSGISAASIVYEAPTESGVTRLMAVFLEHDARTVGPLRSGRPYFVQWAASYKALFLQAGGSPASQQLLSHATALAAVDALRSETEFYRLPSRASPHDLYTSTEGARSVAQRDGSSRQQQFEWLHHARADTPANGRSVQIDFSTPAATSAPEYTVTYHYDKRRNKYVRWVGGVRAQDAVTGQPIMTSNVVVLFTSITAIPSDPLQRINIQAVGSGQAVYLFDGREVRGAWTKASTAAPLQFWGPSHSSIALRPGNTWVEVVPPGAVRFGK